MSRFILWFVTLLRVVLIPVFLLCAMQAQELGRAGIDLGVTRIAALATLFVMGASDVLDGWIARRYDMKSQLGAVVDAVADKLVQVVLAGFFALSVGPVFQTLPMWFLLVVFGRDLVLLVGVLMLRVRYGPLRVVHRVHGRAASMAVFSVFGWVAVGFPAWGLLPLMLCAALMTTASATAYAVDGAAQGEAMVR
jgi:phosphatidylglycerophosphate synthase